MSKSEEKPVIEPNTGSLGVHIVTVVPIHDEGDEMGLRSMTVGRYEEIRRRLAEGRGVREIARALGCARATVREVRDGARVSPDAPKAQPCTDDRQASAQARADGSARKQHGVRAAAFANYLPLLVEALGVIGSKRRADRHQQDSHDQQHDANSLHWIPRS